MATRTFVADGTSRNWSLTTTWAEGAVPTAADDVVFSTNVASSILVIDGTSGSPSLCRSIDTTNYTRTITFGASKQLNVGDGTTGAFKMTAGMTFVPNASSLVKFVSTTTGNNITHGGYAFGLMTYDGAGGAWTWQDANSMSGGNTLTLTNGTLTTNNQNTTNGVLFSSSNSNTRSLVLGTTNWNIGSFNATAWDISTSTGMTLSAASSTLTWGVTAGSGAQFNGGGLTYGTLTSAALTTATAYITGANTFGTLTLSVGASTKTAISGYKLGANQTVTGTFTAAGNTLLLRNFIFSDTIGTARTISAGTFTITNTDLRDITKAGAGSGVISTTSSITGNGDCGGNTGWTFQAPRNVYMKTAVSVNWSAGNWFSDFSPRTTAAVPPLPLCHDSAIFDSASVTAGSKTITVDQPRISGFTFSGVANTPAFAHGSPELEIYGSVILVSGMTHTGTGIIDLMGRGSFSLDGGTLTWPSVNMAIGSFQLGQTGTTSSSYSLAQNFNTGTGAINVLSGSFALNGHNWTGNGIVVSGNALSGTGAMTGTTYTQSGGTTTLGGTMTLTGALALSAGTLNMNSNTITGHTTATISSTGTLNLSGQLNGSGAFSITGGTITDAGASGELKGTTMSFSGGTSSIRKMTASSTFAISSTAALTFNPGTSTWVTSFNETGTTHSLTYNGKATNINGTLTVTAAGGGTCVLQSGIIQGLGAI